MSTNNCRRVEMATAHSIERVVGSKRIVVPSIPHWSMDKFDTDILTGPKLDWQCCSQSFAQLLPLVQMWKDPLVVPLELLVPQRCRDQGSRFRLNHHRCDWGNQTCRDQGCRFRLIHHRCDWGIHILLEVMACQEQGEISSKNRMEMRSEYCTITTVTQC